MYKVYEKYLKTLYNSGHYRRLGPQRQGHTPELLDFSTNDYLGLSRHKDVIAAGALAGQTYGMGATGSRLLSGNTALSQAFETTIAADKGTQTSLLFNSGFQANLSALSCLLDGAILKEKPLVFFDKLNHASLYQAVFLSKAELKRYRHGDMAHLTSLLEHHRHDPRPKFIVTETIFGMDGDLAPLAHITALAKTFNAFLYLDEAHGTGLFGPHGYGLSTTLELHSIPHVIMGTLSKAIGVSGGYVACSQLIRDVLINKATGLIYSTAPSPAVIASAFHAWKMVRSLAHERAHLHALGSCLRHMLLSHGFNIGPTQTHIVPVIFGDPAFCVQVQNALWEDGICVSMIRPPTVPPGTARLRIALTVKHTHSDLQRLVHCLTKALKL